MNGAANARAALVRWMESNGVTQSEIARRTGIPQTSVSRWVLGKAMPKIGAAVELERLTFGAVRVADWMTD